MKRVWVLGLPLVLLVIGGLAAFEVPSKDQRTVAAGRLAGLDPEMRRAFRDRGEFQAKIAPKPNDWLASHEEKGQGYSEWIDSNPNLPDATRRKLYILPVGQFGERAPDLDDLERYTAAYFHPMSVQVLPVVADREVRARSRINRMSSQVQWNSRDILAWMPAKLPEDAYAMLAVTMTDLYPEDSWNFVFGQASIRKRVGVFSFARYHPAWSGADADGDLERLVLRRAAKVLTHEMGHMFGIRHCIYYECNMNGANHLAEADSSPMHLCPVCLRKLQQAVRFDPEDRYRKLSRFYADSGLDAERKWVEARRVVIRGER